MQAKPENADGGFDFGAGFEKFSTNNANGAMGGDNVNDFDFGGVIGSGEDKK